MRALMVGDARRTAKLPGRRARHHGEQAPWGGFDENSWDGTGWTCVAVARNRGGAGLSHKADKTDRAVSGRRAQRHHRARDRSAHVGTDETAGADRQSRRPGRRARHRCGGESKTRRLHHRDLERRRAGHQPQHGNRRLRHAEGSGAGHAGRDRAGDAGGRDQRSGRQYEGADRARQSAARKAQFCLLRSRQPAASGGRTVQTDG